LFIRFTISVPVGGGNEVARRRPLVRIEIIFGLVILSAARRSAATKGKSKDPEDLSSAMLLQEILFEKPVLLSLPVRDGSYYQFWVYILTSCTGTLYVGVTGYLGTRIMQHKIDSFEGFTKKYKIHRLVYYENYEHVMTAIRREKQLKGWRREKKIVLIEKMNPRWQDLAENWGREMRFRGQSLKRTP